MSQSGQMPSDYGEHWLAEAAWSLYGPCGCGAERGKPCWDRRVKHLPPRELWMAHEGRQCFLQAAPAGSDEPCWRDIGGVC